MNIEATVGSLTPLEKATLTHYWTKCFGDRQRKSLEGYMNDQAECVMCDKEFEVIASMRIMRGVLSSLKQKRILWPDDVNGQYNAWFVSEVGWKVMQALNTPSEEPKKLNILDEITRIRLYIKAVKARGGDITRVEVLTENLEALMDGYELLANKVMTQCPICEGKGMDADGDPCVACFGGGKL